MDKKIIKSYKFRLYPNKEQKEKIEKSFGATRFIYNYFLSDANEYYKKNNKYKNYYLMSKQLTNLKKQKEYTWLKEINAQSLQNSLKTLNNAFLRFFKGVSNFPKYKKKKYKNSFCIPQSIKIINNKIYIPKCKTGIKFIKHREIKGTIISTTISKTSTNKYFLCFMTQQLYNPKQKTYKKIGIDLGIKDLVITSKGDKFKNHKFTQKYAKKLKKAQQHLARKIKGSNQYEKQRLKVALIYEKIFNCRLDILHKISHKLVMQNDVVYLENLNIKGLSRSNLAKSVNDCSWGELTRQLHYKGDWDDTYIHEINRFYPSSKICHNCGYIMDTMPLKIRKWTCPKCNKKHDRDINAAINILLEGEKELSVGTTDYTNGEK